MTGLLWMLLATCVAELGTDVESTDPARAAQAETSAVSTPADVLVGLERAREAGEELDVSALEPFAHADLRSALVARAGDPDRTETARYVDLHVLAEFGTEDDLELAVTAGQGPSNDSADPQLQRTLAAILARHPAGLARAARLSPRAPTPQAISIVRAIASRGAEAQVELSALLGRTVELDLVVLSALVGSLRAAGPSPDARGVAAAVRPFLSSEDPQLQREAAAAAAELGDAESLPALIDLVEAGLPPAAPAAHEALVAITGLPWGPDAQRWRGWLAEEQAWFDREAPSLFGDLGDTPALRALAALGQLGGHRYRRDEIAREVLRALDHQAPEVRSAACGTLERLGWVGAVEALVDVLAHDREEVVLAAGRTLRRLTGLSHPDDDLEAWRAVAPR